MFQGTSVLSPASPLLFLVVPAWTIAYKSDQNIYHDHPILYVLVFGLIGAKLTNRLVVAHMCKGEITHRDASLLAPLLLFLNQYFNSYIPEIWLLNLSIVSIHRVDTKGCLLGCLTALVSYMIEECETHFSCLCLTRDIEQQSETNKTSKTLYQP